MSSGVIEARIAVHRPSEQEDRLRVKHYYSVLHVQQDHIDIGEYVKRDGQFISILSMLHK